MKIISTIVLYKHSFNDIEKAINSLLSEASVSKIVLVDNGSFCSWTKTLDNPKIEVISLEKNKGFGSGHNASLHKYQGLAEYFLICNPDCYFEKGELDKLYEYAVKNNLDLALPNIQYPDGQIQYGCKLLPTPTHLFLRRFFPKKSEKFNHIYELREANYNHPFFAPSLSGCFMLISDKAIRDTGGFDPRFFLYMEDIDLSRRISQKHNVSFCPISTVTHEFQKNSYKSFKYLRLHMTAAIIYFNKWGWLRDQERQKMNKICLEQLPRISNEPYLIKKN